MTGKLYQAQLNVARLKAGGTANRVVATADGSAVAMQQIVTAMLAANAVTSAFASAINKPSAAAQTFTSTTFVDITDATVTLTLSANSIVVFVAVSQLSHSAANGRVQLIVANGSGTQQIRGSYFGHATAGQDVEHILVGMINSPGAGSQTYKLQGKVIDTGTCTVNQFGTDLYVLEFKK